LPDRSIAGPLQRQNAPAHPLQKPARTFEDETGQYMPIPQLRKTVAENRRVKRLGKTGARVLTIRCREMTGKRTEAPRRGGASVFLQLFSRSWGWLHRYRRRTSPKILTKMGHFPVSRSNLSKKRSASGGPLLDAINKREPRNLDEGHTNNPAYNVQYGTSLRSGKV